MNMSSSEDFSNIKLVKEIEKYPVLYNFNVADYGKRDACEDSWEKVAHAMNDTAPNCKNKWRNIRTVFVRKLKSGMLRKSKNRPYYLMEALQFLTPFVKGINVTPEEVSGNTATHNETESNETNKQYFDIIDYPQSDLSLSSEDYTFSENDHQFTNDPEPEYALKAPPNRETSNKQKSPQWFTEDDKNFELKRTKYEDESRKMFLLSLLADVQKLSDQKMRIFRRGVLDVLDSLFVDNSPSQMVGSIVSLSKTEPNSID